MGQEHISYIMGYAKEIRIDFLCDPFQPSLESAQRMMKEFQGDPIYSIPDPTILNDEEDLLLHADQIDLLVIASPNYMVGEVFW